MNLFTLLKSITYILKITSFSVIQVQFIGQGQIFDQIYGYLISLSIERQGQLKNIQIDGIELYNFGLLLLRTNSRIIIQDLLIKSVLYQNMFDNQFIVFKDESSTSNIIISNFYLSDMVVENQIQNIFNLIEVQKYAFAEFDYFIISNIYSNNIIKYSAQIFLIDCYLMNLNYFQVSNLQGIDFIQINSHKIMINNLTFWDNIQQCIFKIVNSKPQLLFLMNSTLILKQQVIVFVNSLSNLFILLQDIQINVQKTINQFMIQGGPGIRFNLINVKINILELQFSESSFFQMISGKLLIKNLVARNLYQQLLDLNGLSKAEFYEVEINNVILNAKKFLILAIKSSIIIQNMKIHEIQNCYGLFFISIGENQLVLQNVNIQNGNNLRFVFLFQSNILQKMIILREISIYGVQEAMLFHFWLNYLQQVGIDRLFIQKSDDFNYDKSLNKLTLKNSIIEMKGFSFFNANLKLINTEILFNKSLSLKQIHLDRSYFYDQLKQSMFQETSFVITLSFSRQVRLKSIKLKQSEEIQFLVSQNGSHEYYFYVPTGTKLQEYKKLYKQSHTYKQIFQGFYLVLQGYLFGQIKYQLQCNQYQYYKNTTVNEQNFQDLYIKEGFNEINDQRFIVNPHNKNYTVFQIVCHSDVTNKTVQLYYNVKALPCQLGEYLFQNECLECNLNQSQYSVTHNSTKCNYIDYTQIKSFKKGLLQLHQKYWRHNYYSSIIEYCNSNDCNGGWIPGDNSCIKSRLGALCKECDLYNTKGDGYFTKNNEQCQLCQDFNIKFIFQLLFTILWQLLIIFNGYYSNYKLSQQYLMYRVGFREYYQILYRQSIDQTNIFIKIFINYIFLLYVIRSNLDPIGQTFVVNINIINNPGLILKAQLDCLLSRGFNIEIIYSQYIFQILLVFFILSLSYVLYFIIIQIKKLKFHIGVVLYLTEAILIYNLNIIIDISFNLLSYRLASGQKWIQQNMQYLFYTDQHMQMMKFIIPVTSILFICPIIFPYAMKNMSVFNRLAKRIYAVYYYYYYLPGQGDNTQIKKSLVRTIRIETLLQIFWVSGVTSPPTLHHIAFFSSYLISSQEIGDHKQASNLIRWIYLPLRHPRIRLASSQSFFSFQVASSSKVHVLSFFSCSGLNRLAPSIVCPDRRLRTRAESSSVTPQILLLHESCHGGLLLRPQRLGGLLSSKL